MAHSIMQALFYGEVRPLERRCVMSEERKELEKSIEHEKRHFTDKMSLDDCKRFEELLGLYSGAAIDEEVGIYSHGFTLGALLMMEVIANKEEIVNG